MRNINPRIKLTCRFFFAMNVSCFCRETGVMTLKRPLYWKWEQGDPRKDSRANPLRLPAVPGPSRHKKPLHLSTHTCTPSDRWKRELVIWRFDLCAIHTQPGPVFQRENMTATAQKPRSLCAKQFNWKAKTEPLQNSKEYRLKQRDRFDLKHTLYNVNCYSYGKLNKGFNNNHVSVRIGEISRFYNSVTVTGMSFDNGCRQSVVIAQNFVTNSAELPNFFTLVERRRRWELRWTSEYCPHFDVHLDKLADENNPRYTLAMLW